MGRLVGIDYGLARVGIAVTDPLKIIVSPLKTLDTKNVISFLIEYSKKEIIESFIVGNPPKYNGERGKIFYEVESFISKLKSLFGNISIYTHDESFTSIIAHNSMISLGIKKKTRKQKGNIDMVSASIILESFISYNKNNF